MLTQSDGAILKLYAEILDVLIRLKEKSDNKPETDAAITEIQSKIVNEFYGKIVAS